MSYQQYDKVTVTGSRSQQKSSWEQDFDNSTSGEQIALVNKGAVNPNALDACCFLSLTCGAIRQNVSVYIYSVFFDTHGDFIGLYKGLGVLGCVVSDAHDLTNQAGVCLP